MKIGKRLEDMMLGEKQCDKLSFNDETKKIKTQPHSIYPSLIKNIQLSQ